MIHRRPYDNAKWAGRAKKRAGPSPEASAKGDRHAENHLMPPLRQHISPAREFFG